MKAALGLALFLGCLAPDLDASNPLGAGDLSAVASYQPGSDVERLRIAKYPGTSVGATQQYNAESLFTGDLVLRAPLSESLGFSVDLGGALGGSSVVTTVFDGANSTVKETQAVQAWGLQGDLLVFTQGFAGAVWRPGPQANPDGLPGFPVLALGYGQVQSGSQVAVGKATGGFSNYRNNWLSTSIENAWDAGLLVPVLSRASLWLQMVRQTHLSRDTSTYRLTDAGAWMDLQAGLNLYWNFKDHGQGLEGRPWHPGLGPEGQVRLSASLQTRYNQAGGSDPVVSHLNLDTPINGDAAVGLGLTWIHTDTTPLGASGSIELLDTNFFRVSVTLGYAFGGASRYTRFVCGPP